MDRPIAQIQTLLLKLSNYWNIKLRSGNTLTTDQQTVSPKLQIKLNAYKRLITRIMEVSNM